MTTTSLTHLLHLARLANTRRAWLLLLDHAARWRSVLDHNDTALVVLDASEALGLPNEIVTAYVTGRWPEIEKGEG